MHYLSEYQTFNNTQELNYHVKQHEQAHANELNATDRNILRFIARYSVKYSGASHLKVGTIAEGVSKSERTIARVLKRLESLGIIRRIGMIRPKSGGRGASIIQILPQETAQTAERMAERAESEKATETTDKRRHSENEPLCNRNISNTRTRDGEASGGLSGKAASKRGLSTAIPETIYEALTPYFDARGLYDTYGILLRAKASIDRRITLEDYGDEYVDVFYNVIRKYKLGQVRSLPGLLYSAWQKLTGEISRRIGRKDSVYFDWLA